MNNQDLYKAARGYWTANAVVGSTASKMAELNRQQEAKIAEITSFYSHYQSEEQLADRIGNYGALGDSRRYIPSRHITAAPDRGMIIPVFAYYIRYYLAR